jgi:filamentous hemagglutinin family protein
VKTNKKVSSAVRAALCRPIAVIGGTVTLALSTVALGAELPVVCVAGNCGPGGPTTWVTSGSATATSTADTLTINQSSDRAVLNWASFNVSADGRVIFKQPGASSIALNRIYQESPSRIFGAVEANGQIYLVNPNGFVFGRTARIDASGILASTLKISDATFAAGLLSPQLMQNQQPALESDGRVNVLDAQGSPVLDEQGNPLQVELRIEEGAKLQSHGAGGRVLLASRRIDNSGTVSAPDGQVLLAAGDKVFLQASTDPALRGLLVEVAAGGEAWNRMTGTLTADRGNVTVAGLAVNQSGRISATTTVASNGSVRLLARDNPAFISDGDNTKLGAGQNGGHLELGATSRIEITPELDDPATAVDDQAQLPSRIEMSGREIFMRGGSRIVAPSGEVHVTAARNPADTVAHDPSARIRVESGTDIDLSGSDVTLPMSRNMVTVELRANELRDSPAQRNGALRGQTVVVDARVGTPIADVSGALAAVPKSIAERTSQGGSAVFNSEGDVVVAEGARIDVSGGVTTYEDGPIRTSLLIGADGQLYDIGSADPNRTYVGVLNTSWREVDDRWAQISVTTAPGIGHMEPGYLAGSDAGRVQFAAPNMVLNGTLRAETIVGPYQRTPGSAPRGGELIIGLSDGRGLVVPDYRAPSVEFTTQRAPISIADDAALETEQPLLLPTEYLTRDGFTRAAIFSNGTITVPEDASLDLEPGASLTMTAHRVDVRGDVHAAGGSIKATSVQTVGTATATERAGVSVGTDVTLDVRGNWTNDELAALRDPFGRPTTSIFADGGSISLSTRGDADGFNAQLVLGDGAQLLASGGGWQQQSGTLSPGRGGSIEIAAASRNGAIDVGTGVDLEAYGLLGASGGRFSLTAPRIVIQSGDFWAEAQRVDPLDLTFGALNIGSSLFQDHGFQSIALTASGAVDRQSDPDALRIAAGTAIDLQTRALTVGESSARTDNTANVSGFTSVALPPQWQRTPGSLAFNVAPTGVDTFGHVGSLNMEAGSSVTAAPGSSISLSSVGGVQLAGAVRTPGGSIAVTVKTPSSVLDDGYHAGLGLEIQSGAILDASGTAVYRPNDAGLLLGTLYDGGSVDLRAERGFAVVDAHATIDVSGASAAFDRHTENGYVRETLGSDGGRLSMVAPEAIGLNGTFAAHGGASDRGQASGGELVMRLSRIRDFFTVGDQVNLPTYPTDPRVLRVTSDPVAIGPSAPSGSAAIRRDVIESSGIDALTLEADARIELDAGGLALGRRLVLDTAQIQTNGDVSIRAPYVALANTVPSRTAAAPVAGSGTLSVQGGMIELIGGVSLSGSSGTTLASTGDLRVREAVSGAEREGHFDTAGDLTLRAQRLYPATLTSFAFNVSGAADTTLRIEQAPGATNAPLLSAGGQLTLNAPRIEQAGTLLAPFGSITLNGTQSVILASDSRTSVSGAGAIIPFGRVDNGQWTYQLGGNPLTQAAVPQRQITLSAPAIEQRSGATLDMSGGGDLYAYEWIPGTGGSTDALAADAAPGRYAILPSLRDQFAPYDPQEFADSDLGVGDSIYLSGGGGLEAGFYPLLPARYALLEGAFLIEPVKNTADLEPGADAHLADGTPVVAGYRSFATTGLGSTQFTGFAVRPGEQARQLAAYEDSFASSFYANQAARQDLPRPVLPSDAGALTLLPTLSLDMQGVVNVAAAAGGRAGRIEIAAPSIDIVAAASGASDTIELTGSLLGSWKAGELWIGGTRQGSQANAVAQTVHVAADAQLSADEIVLLARDSITLDDGAQVSSASGRSGTVVDRAQLDRSELVLSGESSGAALVAVSDRHEFLVRRTDAPIARGSVLANTGSVAATRGSLLIDAPAQVALNGDLDVAGASLHLGSDSVAFDDASSSAGLTINHGLLENLGSAAALTIATPGTIEFGYAFDLGSIGTTKELTLQDAELLNSSGGDVRLAADTVRLQGSATSVSTATPGSGTLTLAGSRVEVGAGALAVNGFGRTSVEATTDIVGVGESSLRIGGDLDLTAARVTASSGGNTSIVVDGGNARILQSGTASTDASGLLGGALAITADEIDHIGTLFLPSGLLSLEARSRLTIGSGAVIDASGQVVSAAGGTMGSDGGSIRLTSGGSLDVAGGSRLTVAGASGANGGRLQVRATGAADISGTLLGAGAGAGRGGAFELYAGTLDQFSALNSNLRAGGFTAQQSVHVASGDLQLAAGEHVDAQRVDWSTDAGRITVDGAISTGAPLDRGQIRLNGADGVMVGATGSLLADGSALARFGGDIQLGTTRGELAIASGATVSARGSELNGTLRLRAPATADDVAISSLDGTISNVDAIVVEPFQVHDVGAAPTSTDFDAIRTATSDYMAAAAPVIHGRLNRDNLRIEAGVELQHDGDLQLGALDFSSWRFDGSPVAFTARATGAINVTGTISDGFGTEGLEQQARLTLLDGDSATLRFAAGTDIDIAAGVQIRTGTGDIELTAGRDIRFAGAGSSVFTGGAAGAPTEVLLSPIGASYSYATRGGNVTLRADNDVIGSPVTQSVSDWQRRQGTSVRRTQWGTDLRLFGWNVGSLGGGDVSVTSGRDVTNLSAAAADSAVELTPNQLTRFGGGGLSVTAGRDVSSAMLYAARGRASVHADGALNSARTAIDGTALGTLLLLADTQMDVTARQDIALESIINPTVLAQPGVPFTQLSVFFTYGNDSAVRARSMGGDVVVNAQGVARLQPFLGQATSTANSVSAFILPSTLQLASFSDDLMLNLNSNTTLYGSDRGQLDLFAARDIVAGVGSVLTMSDAAASSAPTPLAPLSGSSFSDVLKHTGSARHAGDAVPASIAAGRDIDGAIFQIAKAVDLRAGRDIHNTTVRAQNLRATDVSSISAGHDIEFDATLLTGELSFGGPGRVDVVAGRNLDLGFSQGLTTVGRLLNPAIASDRGADLNVLVGMARDLDARAFVNDVVAKSQELRARLVEFMHGRPGVGDDSFETAAAAFLALDAQSQRPLLLASFFGELVASGREVNRDPTLGFDRGYRAIDALFPGSRSETEPNPYNGDLTLAFSRIYTLAGGDINIAVPGGLVNVGLANPPQSVDERPPSSLGIVAQRAGGVRMYTSDDVLVNQSRIFTLLGGDIAIWSTTGDIDAGRGAKSSVSAPPPAVLVDSTGRVTLDFAGAVAGSGIRTIATDETVKPGDVDLIAPAGTVNAGDAGIGSAGNLNIAAQQVVGLDNIQVGGLSTGVPAEASGIATSLAGATAAASSASSSSAAAVDQDKEEAAKQPSLAQAALSWLDVFVVGLGEEQCKQDDVECLKRQKN